MAETQERLKWLSELLDEKASRLCDHPSREERTQLLRQLIILLSIEERVREESLDLNEDSSTESTEQSAPDHNPTNQNVTLR